MYMKKAFPKLFGKLYFFLCFLFLFTVNVNAYSDPSVMTYAIQAIAGLAITLGTFFGLYGRKIRKLLFKNSSSSFENMESDHIEFHDPATQSVRSLQFEEDQPVKARKESSEFLPAVFLSVAMGFMLCFYTPLELYFTNIFEFQYDVYGIFKYIALLFLIVTAVMILGYGLFYLISKKLYYVLIILGTIAFLAFYIQGNFLIGDLPPSDGTPADWSKFQTQEMQSLILWIAVTVVCVAIAVFFKKKGFLRFTRIITGVITAILAVTLITVAIKNNGFQHKSDICISDYGMDTLSKDQNLIILVADSVDSKTFENLMNTVDPEYKEIFEDFTYYPDTLAAYPYTTLAVPHILTGKYYLCQDEFRSYFSDAMKSSKLLNRLKEENYVSGIYSANDVIFDDSEFLEYENLFDRPYQIGDPKTFMMDELRLAFFLYMPWQLKKYEPYAVYNLQNEKPADYYYSWLDPWIYNYYDEHPIKLEQEKRFRFIHFEGAHVPLRYDKELNENYSTATLESNTEACVTVLEKILSRLRESGAYDNTAIVILADHGYIDHHVEGADEDPLLVIRGRQNPFLLIKGIGEKHEMKVSDFPVTYDYLEDIYQNLLDGKNGEAVLPDNADKNTDRRFIIFPEDNINDLSEMILPAGAKADEKDKLYLNGVTYSR